MDLLHSMSPCETVALGILIALSSCKDLNVNELNVLGNLFSVVGGIVSTWAAQKQLLEAACNDTASFSSIEQQIQKLQKEYDNCSKIIMDTRKMN